MMEKISYVIEVTNHLTKTKKCVRMEHGPTLGIHSIGRPVLCEIGLFPNCITHDALVLTLDSLKNAPYREMQDGRKTLPEIITRFGSMVLPTRKVHFTVNIYEVITRGSVINTSIRYLEGFSIAGNEGSGKHNRELTNYVVSYPETIEPITCIEDQLATT